MNLPQHTKESYQAMSHFNCISKLLDLQGLLVDSENIYETDDAIILPVYTEKSTQTCPYCGSHTSKVHDYRFQLVKDIPFRRKVLYLKLKKRRYVCPHCGKRFFEHYDFLPRYYHSTSRLYANILLDLKSKSSFKDIASNNFVSTNTVSRTLKLVGFSNMPPLPVALGIDEFKGNCDKQKYHVQLTNLADKKTLDILICRKKEYLRSYFSRYSREERLKVKYLVIDMWDDYKRLSYLFPNAKVIVDKFHYVRQIFWGMDGVRKHVQKDLPKDKRKMFKKLRYLMYKDYVKLNEEEKQTLHNMLEHNVDLENAWLLKEAFQDMLKSKEKQATLADLWKWIETAKELKLPEFENCIKALTNWRHYIVESFSVPYTNAFTEGKHNLIKVLKRNAFGFRNFENFRKRILLSA